GVHALCQSPRNLTDRQLTMIAERQGLVGLNFATVFLRPDGRACGDMGWDPLLRQLDHLIDHLGEGGVALGSDFDGALMPAPLGDVAGLPHMIAALRAHGYDEHLISRIAHRNWIDVLERIWGG
ncbi:MAG: membrane dipeptidase, partial [Pseudomonadota bacterium]